MYNEIYFGIDLLPQERLEHFGIPRRSGRYPWGSGKDPYHHGASSPGGTSIRKARKAKIKEARERAKNVSLMSDVDLDKAINRLTKEKRLRELTDSEYNQSRQAVSRAMNTIVVGTGVSLAATTLGAAGKVYLRRKFGETVTDKDGNKVPVPWTQIVEYLKPKKK